jgi:hypothetical protein
MRKVKNLKNVILIAGITLIVAFLMMLIGNKIEENIIKEIQEAEAYEEWLAENCDCVLKERVKCPEGFQLREQTCFNEKENSVTSRLLACSEYNCLGEIKLWNNETSKWEDKIN